MDIEEKFNKCEARLKELRAVGNSKIGVWKDFYMFCKWHFNPNAEIKAIVKVEEPETFVTPIEEVVEVAGDTMTGTLTIDGGDIPETVIIHTEPLPSGKGVIITEEVVEPTKEELIAEIKKKAMEEINNL